MKSDYELDMEIHPDELDVEWLEQPQLMLKYTRKLAEVRERRDALKEKLEFTRAEIDKHVRENPDDYGISKITEGVVKAAVETDQDFLKVQDQVRKANFEVNVVTGVVQACEQRKQALENLVRLHGQSYFAGPSVPHNLPELKAQRDKASNKRVARTLNRST
jgi:hypothetical protein